MPRDTKVPEANIFLVRPWIWFSSTLLIILPYSIKILLSDNDSFNASYKSDGGHAPGYKSVIRDVENYGTCVIDEILSHTMTHQ